MLMQMLISMLMMFFCFLPFDHLIVLLTVMPLIDDIGHTFFNALQESFANEMYMLPPDGYTTGYAFLMVPGGYFAVDAFFWLGGFLVAYLLVRAFTVLGLLNFFDRIKELK